MSLLNIDLDAVRGLLLIALMIGFLGVWAWAWSSKRKAVFHAASMSPLEEDQAEDFTCRGVRKESRSSPC
jgi:cytochrome c oxidase cbb3-type subunit 4